MENTLCLFVHYSEKKYIQNYVLIYIKELTRFFDNIILITNERQIENINSLPNGVRIISLPNKGLDFGLWSRAIHGLDLSTYNRIGLINDSSILFKSLDNTFEWGTKSQADVWGMTNSMEPFGGNKSKKPIDHYHIQSYFVVVEKNAIPAMEDFFKHYEIEPYYEIEPSNIDLRHHVILNGEICFSQHFLHNGFVLKTKYNAKNFQCGECKNVHLWCWHHLIRRGYPLIKKKIVLGTFPAYMTYQPFRTWQPEVQNAKPSWDFDLLFGDI